MILGQFFVVTTLNVSESLLPLALVAVTVTANVESPNWLSEVSIDTTLVDASKVMNVPVELSILME